MEKMENLSLLQSLVQDQITKATKFKKKMENQFDQLNFNGFSDSETQSLQSNTSDNAGYLKSSTRKQSAPPMRVSFAGDTHFPSLNANPPDLLQSSSATSLFTSSLPIKSSERQIISPGLSKDNLLPVLKTEESSPLKLTVPKASRKKSVYDSQSTTGQHRVSTASQLKRVNTGKGKRVSVHAFAVEESKDPATNCSTSLDRSVSPQLISDIGDAFKGIYDRRKLPSNMRASHPYLQPLINFESRVRTPPELSTSDTLTTQSQVMADSFIEELNDMEKSFEEGRNMDLSMNLSVKELSSMANKEQIKFDSISLYVETKYIEMKEHEKNTGNYPTRLKTAICADLLLKLSQGIKRYGAIMEPLIWELLNGIFFDFARRDNLLITRENLVSELLKLRGYFEMYQEARDALEDISSELYIIQQGMRLKDIVKKFQTVRLAFNQQLGFLRDLCFKAWKSFWTRIKRGKRIARRRGIRYRWNIWRQFVKRRNEREMEEYSSVLDQKINRLVELNNLITTHSRDEIGSPSKKSMIVFGTAEKIDPKLVPPPINTSIAVTESPVRTFAERKTIIQDITKKVSQNFETVTIATTPSMRRMMSAKIPLKSPSIDEVGTSNFNSHALEPSPEELTLMARLEEVVKVTTEIANEKKDQITQTPDEWMMGIDENNLLSHLSVSQSFAINKSYSADFTLAGSESRDSIDLSAGLMNGRRGSIAKYQINSITASQLIAYIYENRYADIIENPLKGNFAGTYPLLQFTKQLLLKRYSLRRLAQKFYRGLVSSCIRESLQSKRLELFGLLCGLPLPDKIDSSYDADRCTFFFRILYIFFRKRLDQLANTLASKEIDRAVVLALMPEIFHELKDNDIEYYQNIIYDIVDLPSTDPHQIDRVYKVDFDEVLSIMMDVFEVKYRKRQDPSEAVAVALAVSSPHHN